jgi:uncharacterized phage protein gp47/JayE
MDIIDTATDYILSNTSITNMNPGGIARSITEAMAPEYESLYDFAQDVLDQGILSKATLDATTNTDYLALIGGLFNYPRRTKQVLNVDTGITEEQPIDDDTYRYEISQQVQAQVSSNEQAVRLAALTADGVADIIIQEYTHGSGSFSIIVMPVFGFDDHEVLNAVIDKVNDSRGLGIRANITLPVYVDVDVSLQLVFKDLLAEDEKQNTIFDITSKITDYLGNYTVGQSFVYNDFVAKVMESSDNIQDFIVVSLNFNDTPVLLMNQTINDDERIRPRNITVA